MPYICKVPYICVLTTHQFFLIVFTEDERHLISGLALKIRYRSRTNGPEGWRATEKPDAMQGVKT